jgi:hypothetical protein
LNPNSEGKRGTRRSASTDSHTAPFGHAPLVRIHPHAVCRHSAEVVQHTARGIFNRGQAAVCRRHCQLRPRPHVDHPAESAGTQHSIPTSTCLQGHSSPSTEQQLVRSAYAVEGQRRCGSLAQEISRRGTTSCRVHTPTRPASASTARGSQGISPRRSRCPPKGEAPCRQ